MNIDLSHARQLYKDMLLIRRFEEKASQLYGMGHIAGFCHLYIGQEAVVVGAQDVMQSQDTVITAYRDHGHMLACGMDPKGVMAELTGRQAGYSKGKGGSMHMFSREKNFFGGHGIVGAQVSIGTGMAFAHKYKQDNGVCLTYFGDGAANQGQVYESFNMASLWGLPVLYIIENNGYAMGTSTLRGCANDEKMHTRGEPFGIQGIQVDGMDVLAVRDAVSRALHTVRTNMFPMIVEVRTYRYRGHSMSDPAGYRSKEEVTEVKTTSDPLANFKEQMRVAFSMKTDDLKDIENEVRDHMKEVAEFAITAPEPDAGELMTDILIEEEAR
ncbi:MAG: pyruvate dehydrogenase (acetyl-transferring) E1 component subunit alpha [Alphaproteobacteria bacterium]|nr:MAG: pyruvate dehydrogenase (acetyl-transferring) E1 component subunit alpha [Alphaproteobacteria bacterium]